MSDSTAYLRMPGSERAPARRCCCRITMPITIAISIASIGCRAGVADRERRERQPCAAGTRRSRSRARARRPRKIERRAWHARSDDEVHAAGLLDARVAIPGVRDDRDDALAWPEPALRSPAHPTLPRHPTCPHSDALCHVRAVPPCRTPRDRRTRAPRRSRSRSSTLGTKPAPMPWMSVHRRCCRPRARASSPARRRSMRIAGSSCLSTSPTPVIVPPVPTPATNASIACRRCRAGSPARSAAGAPPGSPGCRTAAA